MKKKYLLYALVPAFAFSLVGLQAASAHGFIDNATPDQIAERHKQMFQDQADQRLAFMEKQIALGKGFGRGRGMMGRPAMMPAQAQ
jgi:hypothetical protein